MCQARVFRRRTHDLDTGEHWPLRCCPQSVTVTISRPDTIPQSSRIPCTISSVTWCPTANVDLRCFPSDRIEHLSYDARNKFKRSGSKFAGFTVEEPLLLIKLVHASPGHYRLPSATCRHTSAKTGGHDSPIAFLRDGRHDTRRTRIAQCKACESRLQIVVGVDLPVDRQRKCFANCDQSALRLARANVRICDVQPVQEAVACVLDVEHLCAVAS